MSTISEIKQRANALANKTDVNSITPKEVGDIMYDLGSYGEHTMRNGGTLGIRKVYESVAAMEADSISPVDLWGNPIKKGNLVVIYDGTTTGVDNNKIYAFFNPGWKLATELDAGYAMRAETEAKLSELAQEVGNKIGEIATFQNKVAEVNVVSYQGQTYYLSEAIEGHRYVAIFSSENNAGIRNYDANVGWLDTGRNSGGAYIKSSHLTARKKGNIVLYTPDAPFSGTVYLFDTTGNDYSHYLLLNYGVESFNNIVGGIDMKLEKSLLKTVKEFEVVANGYIIPLTIIPISEYKGQTFRLIYAEEGCRYIAVLDSTTDAYINNYDSSSGWIDYGSSDKGIGEGFSYSSFTASRTGELVLVAPNTYTGNVYLFDTTNNDKAQDELKTNGLKNINTPTGGIIKDIENVSERNNEIVEKTFAFISDIFRTKEASSIVTIQQCSYENIDGNVVFNTRGDAAHVVTKLLLESGRKYIVYYELLGKDKDWSMTFRLFDNGWSDYSLPNIYGFADTISSSTMYITPNKNGTLSFMFNNLGEFELGGVIKIFDVTDLQEKYVDAHDFSSAAKEEPISIINNKTKSTSSWEGKTIAFYGDSITAQNTYQPFVQKLLGCKVVNNGVGGSRIVYEGESSFSSDSRIAQMPTDVDAVLIMGGTNDWKWSEIETTLEYNDGFDRTKFKGALAYTIQKMQERCPNALIVVATNIGGRGTGKGVIQPLPLVAEGYSGDGKSALDIRNAEIEVAEFLNVPVCDTWSCGINGFNRVTTISDAVHPNLVGSKLIGEYIAGFFISHPRDCGPLSRKL